jgi:CO dehydrogenase maturation factor
MHLVQHSPIRVALVGKGGAGKSVIAGTLARLLARRGPKVLALDSDMMPGLALSLGAAYPKRPPLLDAAEQDEDGRWHLKKGIGPVRALQEYSTAAPDGVRLLSPGKAGPEGLAPIMGALNAYYELIRRFDEAKTLKDWVLIGDLPAGPRQTAFGWASFARDVLVVVEPEWKSILTARRLAKIAAMRTGVSVAAVANKINGRAEAEMIRDRLNLPVIATVPDDDAIRNAELAGTAPIDAAPDSAAVRAVDRLSQTLAAAQASGTLG